MAEYIREFTITVTDYLDTNKRTETNTHSFTSWEAAAAYCQAQAGEPQ